jgi:hypothetical protein
MPYIFHPNRVFITKLSTGPKEVYGIYYTINKVSNYYMLYLVVYIIELSKKGYVS